MNGPPPRVENVPKIAILSVSGRSGRAAQTSRERWPREVADAVELMPIEPGLADGARKKRALRRCIDAGYRIAVMLEDVEQNVVDLLPQLTEPLTKSDAAAVIASVVPARARSFSAIAESQMLRTAGMLVPGFTPADTRPGIRLYALEALARLPFEKNADDERFDAQLLVQLRASGMRIVELPLPAEGRAAGSSAHGERGVSQAWEVLKSTFGQKLHEVGLASGARFELPPQYTMKASALSSHASLLELVGESPQRVLDVGCGQGQLGSILRARGHHVTGIDMDRPRFELDEFIQADLSQGLPLAAGLRFDVIILADVLEHMPDPLSFLKALLPHVVERGIVLVSLPNVVHWSVRGQVALGRFEYTSKGLLDRGHLRFFTRASAKRLFQDAGLAVVAEKNTPVPWENLVPKALGHTLVEELERVDHLLGRALPNLFAYQHIFKLQRESRSSQRS